MGSTAIALRAGVYGRESKGKKKSVDDQLALGLRVVDDHGWTHAGTYDDGSSASRFATKVRPDWHRLDADIKAHRLDVLVIWEITRGTRETVDGFQWLNACRDNGVFIYLMNEEEQFDPRKTSHYDRLGRMILDGATESNKTSDRVLRGVREAAVRRDGATPHGRQPYGYTRQLRNPELVVRPEKMPWDEFYRQIPDPVTSPVVVEIFRRIARSEPIVRLVEDLDRRKIPGPGGGRWNRKAVRSIIVNVAYKGVRRYADEDLKAVWPGLVTEFEWSAANRVVTAPDRQRSKPGLKKYLASYLMLSKCGHQMQGVPPDRGQQARYRCTKDGCIGIGMGEVDEYLTRLVVARFMRDDARDLFIADETELRRAEQQLAALEQRLESFRQSATAGETSPASLAVVERDLSPQIEGASRKVLEAEVPAAMVDLIQSSDVRAAFDALPLAGRREVLSLLFAGVKVGAPGETRLHRGSTLDERLTAVDERVTVEWRR